MQALVCCYKHSASDFISQLLHIHNAQTNHEDIKAINALLLLNLKRNSDNNVIYTCHGNNYKIRGIDIDFRLK